MNTPLDDNGRPMALVRNGASEKIGLPNYSSIEIGPASIMRWVEDTPVAIQAGLTQCLQDCEAILSAERTRVLALLGGKA
jgi:hypothetical protein